MSVQSFVASALNRLASAIVALNAKVEQDLTPVTGTTTPATGDQVILKRGSSFYLGAVDTLLGGGGGAEFPIEVAAPTSGLEVITMQDGVAKRTPIASLINEAYPAVLGLWDYWTDWRAASGNANAPGMFVGAAVSSGTNSTALPTGGMAGYNDHGVFLRSSTTANGGYRYQTTSLVGMYFGAIARKFRGQFMHKTQFTGVTVRLGFHDTNTSADAADGAYFEIVGSTCSAKTASNSVRTTHATTITLALDTPYTFDIEVNAAATEARFRVWGGNNYATALMDVTITTNIPNTSARAFGAGIVATEASTVALDIGILYSLGLGTPAGFARANGIYGTPLVYPSAFGAGDWTVTATVAGFDLDVDALPASGSAAVTALRYRTNGGAPVTLSGTGLGVRSITGLSEATLYPVQIQQVTSVGESPWSDLKNVTTLANSAPTAFTAGMWTLTGIAGGLRFGINSVPAGTLTALQYRLNSGSWVNFSGGVGTGNRDVLSLPETLHTAEVRAVNAVGNGPDSDTKSATPLAAGGGGTLTISQGTGADIVGGEYNTYRNGGGTNPGYWEPGVGSGAMLWRPGANFNTTNIPGTITGAVLRLYMHEQFGASTVTAYDNLRAWVNTQTSWTEFASGSAWQTAGGSGALDRSAAAIGTEAAPATNGVWVEIDLDPAVVEAWRQEGGVGASGCQLVGNGQFSTFYTDNNTDNLALRPQLVVTHA